MKRLAPIVLLTAACCLWPTEASVIQPNSAREEDGSLQLMLLHNNDMHARFEQTSQIQGATCKDNDKQEGKCYGGFARVATVVKNARLAARDGRGPQVLYLNAGDTYTGTVWFTVYKWQIAAALVNALKPDVVSLGNHEFDENVSGLTPFIENLKCPIVTANIDLSLEPALAAENNLMKSTVITINGVNVGVIGYLTPDTQFLSKKNNVTYIDEVVAIREEAKKLKERGVNILIALGHSGYKKDLEIAKEVEDIDVVIGGHTNTFLWNGAAPDAEKVQGDYPAMVTQESGRMVPVVQAYAYTKYLGNLTVTFNAEGELESFAGQPILLNSSIEEDPQILKLLDDYRPFVTQRMAEVIGSTRVTLDGDCRLKECNLGNLITDAMVYRYANEYPRNVSVSTAWTNASIALISGGGIRASIVPADRRGEITRGELLEVLPFEGNMRVVTINGTTLLRALEQSVQSYDPISIPGAFLQVSGVRVTYDLSKAAGSRIERVVVRCWSCVVPQYYEVEEQREYKVLMPEFLAAGGDGFYMFESEAISSEELNYNQLDCLIDYLTRRNPVYPEVAERIILLNTQEIEDNDSSSGIKLSAESFALFSAITLIVQLYI